MTQENYRSMVKWVGLLVIAHAVAWLFFIVILSSYTSEVATRDPDLVYLADNACFIFSLVFELVFLLFYSRGKLSERATQTLLEKQLNECGGSVLRTFRKYYLRDTLVKTAAQVCLQIPYTVFFALFGISYTARIFVDKIFVMEAGYYTITHSAIGGLLLGGVAFGVLFAGVRIVLIYSMIRKEL